jgi:hypothetical protein
MFARGPSFPIQMAMEMRLQLQHILSNANNWHVSSQFHDILVSIYNVIKYVVITLVGCILVLNLALCEVAYIGGPLVLGEGLYLPSYFPSYRPIPPIIQVLVS